MFVLEYSEGNTLTADNKCSAYHRVETARKVMECQLERILAECGYSVSSKVECAPGFNDLYGSWNDDGVKVYLGFLNDFDAYLEDGEHRWVIHEVPGAFIPERVVDEFKKSMSEAPGMRDYVYWKLEEYLG